MQKDFYAKRVLPKVPLIMVIICAIGALVGIFVAQVKILRIVAVLLLLLFAWLINTYLRSYYHPALLLQVTDEGLIFLPGKKDQRRVSWKEIQAYRPIEQGQGKKRQNALEVYMKGNVSVTMILDHMENGEDLRTIFFKREIPMKEESKSNLKTTEEEPQD